MINVIGLGYIGLPTALMFSKNNIDVIGTDIDDKLIDSLSKGSINFDEKGLEVLFKYALRNNIKFSTKYQKTNIYIVSVPTPYINRTKKIDLRYVITAVNRILDVCEEKSIIIIESTLSPGSVDKYIRPQIKDRGFKIGIDIHLVHAPERIIPGNMIYELEHNPRIIGADDVEVGVKIKNLYASFCKSEIVVTDIKSAEMCKVVENTYRDVNIAFANELAKICREDNIDVYNIIKISNMHPRVNILKPGPGVGGHCISVDPWFLVGDYPDLTNLILSARKVNDSMPQYVLKRIRDIMKENNIDDVSKVGLYGLTYKEDVNDIRESPTLQLLKNMDEHLSFGVKVYDPFVKTKIVDNQFIDFKEFIDDIEVLVIITSHNHIKKNFDKISNKIILDTKDICNFEGVYKL